MTTPRRRVVRVHPSDEPVRKCDRPIGSATATITPGQWIHARDPKTLLEERLEPWGIHLNTVPGFAGVATEHPVRIRPDGVHVAVGTLPGATA
jgi:hypothetical protein